MPWYFRFRLFSFEFGQVPEPTKDDSDGGLEGTVGGEYADADPDIDGAMGERDLRRMRPARDRLDARGKRAIGFVP